jgi:hypothetical protein
VDRKQQYSCIYRSTRNHLYYLGYRRFLL